LKVISKTIFPPDSRGSPPVKSQIWLAAFSLQIGLARLFKLSNGILGMTEAAVGIHSQNKQKYKVPSKNILLGTLSAFVAFELLRFQGLCCQGWIS
jgi:hypothetical protein